MPSQNKKTVMDSTSKRLPKLDKRFQKYGADYESFGYGLEALSMPSDRRTVRYYELIKNFSFFRNRGERFSILDAGCGFADLNKYLHQIGCNDYAYYAVDGVPQFIEYVKENTADDPCVAGIFQRNFFCDDFSDIDFDYAVSSQSMNDCYSEAEDNFDAMREGMSHLFQLCKKGISFNFFTNKVETRKPGTAYHSPEKVLSFAYELTNCVILDNSCLPYECTVTMMKDKASDHLVFDMFKERHKKEFADGVFVVKTK